MNTLKFKPSDSVYVGGSYGGFHVATVAKVTPKGMVDIKYPHSDTTYRYNAEGREIGKDRYCADYIDELPFDERTALIETEKRQILAAKLISQVTAELRVNWHWGKAGLMTEVERLEGLLAAARAATEAI